MPARKPAPRGSSNPSPEAMQSCLSMLQQLRPEFVKLQGQPKIEEADLESLTNRFATIVIEMYGANTQQSERYEEWRAYWHPSYNTNDPDYVFEQKVQKAFQEGVKRTLTEIDSVTKQLEMKLQHLGITKMTATAEVALALQLCGRLNHSAKVLNRRQRNKPPFDITDEYDVQDLLKSILRAYFKYAVSEDPISKVAGVSSRADFAIEDLGVVIEVKYVHGPSDQSRLVKEYGEDLLFYSKCPFLEHFIYVVYGADDLNDPELLDKLSGPHTVNGKRFIAHIVRCPN